MIVALGSDHAGYVLKEELKRFLAARGCETLDFGTDSGESVDYPDFIIPAAEAVADGRAHCGIVIGGSGNGEAIAANKVEGIRCALCWNTEAARLAKQHNNANMIALGARLIAPDAATGIVATWLDAEFEAGRHVARIAKIARFERGETR
ncbi:ribose 5-phosphate isomerase B [Desulfoprunum benzoelyticum]|uniref:Ribose 5-phosphate isomerase B n=1 Tax=Desulfoprunum benzoelyticum TaxID=1506996 RepID=A0A840UTU1_9BACT|nr:ribose 5-phosphate isomerase B [Desulfoprunum benzoelyticum]MBB5348256.1 ribose 5-phosphate isomerase B [Desulfoprunum benzoelyticum]MBM9529552.1 ribose 5-phosphate isomerase B [Desulfoprunum benzoelyticum]